MSDAFHLLSDVASFIVALAAIYLAEKPATRRKFYFINYDILTNHIGVLN